MVHFNDIVSPDALATGLSVNGKKQLFQRIAALAADAYGLDADMVADALFDRERLGSTGFGGGVRWPLGASACETTVQRAASAKCKCILTGS